MDTSPLPDGASWPGILGIADRESGLTRARAARERLIAAGRHVLGSAPDYTVELVVFSGLLSRAQGFHEASVAAVEADNPYAAFTLIRAYAENAAVILYVKDRPGVLDVFWRDPNSPAVSIGKITNYAQKRFAGFREIYGQLSQYAHPAARSLLASHRIAEGEARNVRWSSAPSFKFENDAMVACGWIVELAEASSHLFVELADSWTVQRPLT